MLEALAYLLPLAAAALLAYPLGRIALMLGRGRAPTTPPPPTPDLAPPVGIQNEAPSAPAPKPDPSPAAGLEHRQPPAPSDPSRTDDAPADRDKPPTPSSKPPPAPATRPKPVHPPEDEPDPLEELDRLIGLASVKEEVRSLKGLAIQRKRRRRRGLRVPEISYHLVFTGNPGTGKTTVARIIGRIYKEIGILKKGHMVEVNPRADMIAPFIGQTAAKTTKVVQRALDGVLFIDEAYSLVHSDSFRDFGPEAVAALITHLENDRDRLIVIAAGYKDEMKAFINSNPGLESRFPTVIEFPDFTPAELLRIFDFFCEQHQNALTSAARAKLAATLTAIHAARQKNFGNARVVRNIYDMAIKRQAARLAPYPSASERELITFEESDIPGPDELGR